MDHRGGHKQAGVRMTIIPESTECTCCYVKIADWEKTVFQPHIVTRDLVYNTDMFDNFGYCVSLMNVTKKFCDNRQDFYFYIDIPWTEYVEECWMIIVPRVKIISRW